MSQEEKTDFVEFSVSANFFQKITEACKMLKDANFKFTEKGFGLQKLDPSCVSFMDFFLPKSYFDSFKCTKPGVIGINFANLSKVLKFSRIDDKLTLNYVFGEDFLSLTFGDTDTYKKILRFKLFLMNIDDEDFEIPILDV